jgi:hypothetical protein
MNRVGEEGRTIVPGHERALEATRRKRSSTAGHVCLSVEGRGGWV